LKAKRSSNLRSKGLIKILIEEVFMTGSRSVNIILFVTSIFIGTFMIFLFSLVN
jgi:hypothetical protein